MGRKYQKLVRDNIPSHIEANGEKPVYRVMAEGEYVSELKRKLYEEVGEFSEEASLGELADIFEVCTALAATLGFSQKDLLDAAAEKRERNGGFDERFYLEGVEGDGNEETVPSRG